MRELAIAGGPRLSRATLAAEMARAAAWLDEVATPSTPLGLVAELRPAELVVCLAALASARPLFLVHPRWPVPQRTAVSARLLPALSWRSRPWRRTPPSANLDAPWDARAAVFVATSGSSGAPRWVELSRRACAAAAALTARALEVDAAARLRLALPYAHVGGLAALLRAHLHGAAVVVGDSGNASHVSLTPTQLARAVAAGRRAPRALRHLLVGGAACAPSLLADARRLGWPVHTSYGLTETAGMVALDGRALDGVRLRITAAGRVAVASPTLMTRYLGGARVAREFVTSDRGHLDGDGRLQVDGRADDVVICGGENVSPSAVEALLAAHPRLRAACVLPEPDAQWGHTLAAVLQPRGASAGLLAELERWMRARLSPWQRPRRLRLVSSLPLGASGKVDRRAARDLL